MSARLESLAADLERAHRERRPASLPPDLSREEAYRLQDLVFAALAQGARPVAWKVGGPSENVEPTMAKILPGQLFDSPARIACGHFRIVAVEIEVAFRMAGEREGGEALAAIEVCNTRLADFDHAPAMAKLADFQSNAALVVGSGSTRWRDIDFRQQRAELWIDGRLVREVKGAHPYGNPARLIAWAADHASHRGGLRAGDALTTGSWTGMEFVSPGAEVRAVFPGLGEAAVKLEG